MRHHLVLLTDDGWADGVLAVAATAVETALRGRRAVEVDQDTAHAVGLHTELYHHDPEAGLQRLSSPEAIYRRLRSCTHPRRVMGRLAELGGHAPTWIPASDRACAVTPLERRPGFVAAEVGPVTVSLCDEASFAQLEATVAASGLYDPARVWDIVRGWECDPHTWPLVWTWQGQPLQYEVLHLEPQTRQARFGFTTHLSDRPAWWWQRVEVPVLLALHEAGIDEVITVTRADARHWIDSVKAAYGAQERRYDAAPQWVRLVFDPAKALAAVDQPWPARRTVVGWSGEVREVDHDTAEAALLAAWAGKARVARARQLLDERWTLDAATLLLAEPAGESPIVYAIRERTAVAASLVCLTPFSAAATDGRAALSVAQWLQAAGYATAGVYLWPRHQAAPLGARWLARWGFRATGRTVTKDGETWDELTVDLAAALARPAEAWTA